jgi:DHA2 family multidrug resistance protein
VVLDKGEREDWFHSNFILVLTLISAVALVAFVLVELRTEHPVVDLRVFKDRSFATGTAIMFAGFFCLFGSIVLLPLYLQKLMGYTAFWAGMVLGPGGLASFFIMPVAGVLMKKGVNPRNLLALGLCLAAYSLLLMAGFDLTASFSAISWPRVVQGFGMGLFFVPLSAATYVNIAREKLGNASGIFNLLRNLGGSFGVAFSTTVLAQRAQLHQTHLVEHITPYEPSFQIGFQEILQWLHSTHPELANTTGGLMVIYGQVLRQASMLSFNDTFWLLAWFTAALVPLTMLFRRPQGPLHTGGAH